MEPMCAVNPAILVSNSWDEHVNGFWIVEICFVPDILYVWVRLLYLISVKSTIECKIHQKPTMYAYVYNVNVQNEWITSQARAVSPTVVAGNQM